MSKCENCERLQQLLACAYQLAGTVGAPVRFLDAFSRFEGDIDSLLPVSLDECDEFVNASELARTLELLRIAESKVIPAPEPPVSLDVAWLLTDLMDWSSDAEGDERNNNGTSIVSAKALRELCFRAHAAIQRSAPPPFLSCLHENTEVICGTGEGDSCSYWCVDCGAFQIDREWRLPAKRTSQPPMPEQSAQAALARRILDNTPGSIWNGQPIYAELVRLAQLSQVAPSLSLATGRVLAALDADPDMSHALAAALRELREAYEGTGKPTLTERVLIADLLATIERVSEPWKLKDHGCQECVPGEDVGAANGFRCARHRALALLGPTACHVQSKSDV